MAFFLLKVRQIEDNSLKHFIDPKLLPFLTIAQAKQPYSKWLIMAILILSVIGISGISWKKAPQNTFTNPNKTVIILDQSISMYATDIQPNRLTRAKQRVRDLFEQMTEEEIALVAFAGDAYTISPFSKDKNTLTHFILALDPLIMPLYGSNLSAGIETSLALLDNPALPAHFIIITDDLKESESSSLVSKLRELPIQVDIIGMGTTEGGIIRLPDGKELKDKQGFIRPVLPVERLRRFASELNGRYFNSQLTESDIQQILDYQDTSSTIEASKFKSQLWQDYGHWFLFPLLVWLLLQFRKGTLFGLFIVLLGQPDTVSAQPMDWFKTPDQKAQTYVDEGQWEQALDLFQDPRWKSASNYALEKYGEAANMLNSLASTAADYYNLGNSLALSNQIDDAIQAYEKALSMAPDLQEAQENLKYLKDRLQKEQEQKKEQEQEQPNNENQTPTESDSDQKDSDKKDKAKGDNTESMQELQSQDANNNQQNEQSNDELTAEEQLALDQWLRQIQDDPGGLLQRKLLYLHQEKRAENRFRQEDGLPIW